MLMISFTEDLALTLALTIEGKAYQIPAGNVKTLELTLQEYGYNGKISFIVSTEKNTDTLFTPITQNNLIEVSLQVEVYFNNTQGTMSPLKLTGLVSEWGFSEQTLTNILPTQELMLFHHYTLTFADPAQVLWKQHYPCDLLTNSTLKALITAHTPKQISLVYNWEFLTTEYPFLSLSLGAPYSRSSFYDYLLWLVDSQNGMFTYDFAKNNYTLSDNKIASGTAESLNPLEIANFAIKFPQVNRYQPNVLNSYTESPKITAITNAQMATPIRRDYIASYPIASNMQARVTLETARFHQPLHEVCVEYKKFQLQITPPGQIVKFDKSSAWNKSIYVYGNTYKVKKWYLHAVNVDKELTIDLNNAYGHYEIEQDLLLAGSADQCVVLPDYIIPAYPFFVEGKIVSETGATTDTTYQFYTDKTTSVKYYQISIPLWTNKIVRATYQPNFDAGQFYFPPYKNARVLVGLGFDTAFISSFLDWGAGTALSLDSQGNQLVMGQSATSQNIIKHSYVDKKPELQIQRTQDKDTELLQFSDGYIILQTQQEE